MQDGDPYPDFPEDGDLPEGDAEVKARMEAATAIKGRGNDLFKQVRGPSRVKGGKGLSSAAIEDMSSESKLPYSCSAGRLGADLVQGGLYIF